MFCPAHCAAVSHSCKHEGSEEQRRSGGTVRTEKLQNLNLAVKCAKWLKGMWWLNAKFTDTHTRMLTRHNGCREQTNLCCNLFHTPCKAFILVRARSPAMTDNLHSKLKPVCRVCFFLLAWALWIQPSGETFRVKLCCIVLSLLGKKIQKKPKWRFVKLCTQITKCWTTG